MEHIEGTYLKTLFFDAETGRSAFLLQPELKTGISEPVKIVGKFCLRQKGLPLSVEGTYTETEYGKEFHIRKIAIKAISMETTEVFLKNLGLLMNMSKLKKIIHVTGTVIEKTITEDPEGSIKLQKVDGNGNPLSGAVVSISQSGVEIKTAISKADGWVTFEKLKLGSYTVKEKEAPPGYVKSSYKRTVKLTKTNPDVIIEETWVNTRTTTPTPTPKVTVTPTPALTPYNSPKTEITIRKYSDNAKTKPLNRAGFIVMDIQTGTIFGIGKTGTGNNDPAATNVKSGNGYVTFTDLPVSYISVSENKTALRNYEFSVFEFQIPDGYDFPVYANLVMGSGYASASVYNYDSASLKKYIQNNFNNVTDNLWYDCGAVAANGSIQVINPEVTTNKYGSVKIYKVDQNGKPLGGALFGLKQNGTVKYKEYSGYTDGIAYFENIPYGTYTVAELEAPVFLGSMIGLTGSDRYILNPMERNIVISDSTPDIVITGWVNQEPAPPASPTPTPVPTSGKIIIQKTDDGNTPLNGASFLLTISSSLNGTYTNVASGITSTVNGQAGYLEFNNLPFNYYYKITELQTPGSNYQKAADRYVYLSQNGSGLSAQEIAALASKNKQSDAPASEQPQQDTGGQNPIITYVLNDAGFVGASTPNAVAVPYGANTTGAGYFNAPYAPNAGNMWLFDGWYTSPDYSGSRYNGTYSMTSNLTLYGHFVMKASTEPIQTLSIVDPLVNYGFLRINKSGSDGSLVSGAVFALYDSTGRQIQTLTTYNSVATADKLAVGNYILVETYVPSPYILDTKQIYVTVNRNQQASVNVVNKKGNPAKGMIELRKIDASTSLPMQGAEFIAKQWNANTGSYESTLGTAGNFRYDTNTQTYKLENLPITDTNLGKFYVVETKVPDGYDQDIPYEMAVELSEDNGYYAYLSAVNQPTTPPGRPGSITVYKRFKKDQVEWSKGTPTFNFVVEGTDSNTSGTRRDISMTMGRNDTFNYKVINEDGEETVGTSAYEIDGSGYTIAKVKVGLNGVVILFQKELTKFTRQPELTIFTCLDAVQIHLRS